ncbi:MULTISPECIES: Stk1 family PASTA domain-containing Ser/Thr kinase [Rhodococcus]|uniref:Stk1 family PASTA domain-containing Ser/Thr kinase n=1 Tax=Rhodococcus TaxID=1827 RepID=UPI00055B08B9|nr:MULTISPECIES: Stk1 family PASTA domain-containing Ser/Thr kinase [Rhodococcus]WAM14245.1 Stk1 family PASTA domain-containing Ser/Thr kinase [Rhodococcus sp. JS3073]
MHDGGQRLIGELLDRRYRVDATIARGGMSTVYRGLDTRLDRPVAIKVMDPQFAADPAFVTRFEFEARSVARLKHPSLVAVYDQGHDREHAFLVMELVDGGTLRELLRERGPMPPHAVAAVAGPVLDALAVAHRAGLVHRDVKPENILISDGGEVKIADFGLVRAAAASTTTSNSVILGTAAYLSPEQVTSGIADTRSDVYSTGVLLFELLTGRTPFTGDTSLSVAYQRINQDVPRPGSFIAGVPPEFDELVAEATHREPSHRFANAEQMGSALRGIAAALDLPAYRVPAPRRSAQHLSAAAAASAPPLGAPPGPAAPPTVHLPPAAPLSPPSPLPAQPGVQHTRVVTTQTPRPPIDEPSFAAEDEPDDGYHYPDFAAERQRSRRTTIVWLLVILMLALAVGFGGWWMGSGRFTAVPTTDGLDRGAAVTAIEAAGLSTEIRGKYSDTAALDTVLGTDPTGGSRISRDGTVALLVSLGRPTVPPLPAGGERAGIEQELRNRTFTPVDGGQAFSAKVPIGAVAALDPAPGTELATGSTVKLIVSKGAPPVDVPDVKGMSEAEARTSLEAVGIVVQDVTTDFDRTVAAGDAIATSPKAGTSVNAGTSVTLSVSNAVRVPSMLGRTVGSARDELSRLGLDVKVRSVTDTDRSFVISQNPGSGDLVKPGSTVTLVSLP